MPIDTQCEHCGFAYVSKDEMAGKRVRCRNCGQVFTIRNPQADAAGGSAAGQPDLASLEEPFNLPQLDGGPSPYVNDSAGETSQLPAVSKFESNMTGGVGSAKSRLERTGDAEIVDFVGPQPGELNRPSVPFRFPYAGDLDDWLPRIVPAAMLAWFFYLLWNWRPSPDEVESYPRWAGLIPLGVLLLLFLIFWIPIFAGAVRKVATAMHFTLPTRTGIRATCLASVPFALGGMFWLAGESMVTMVIGLLLGAAIAAPGAWFLYRLRQAEIAHGVIALAFATVLSAGLTVGVLYGANLALNKALNSTGQGKLFAQSPMGPDLPWEVGAEPAKPTSTVRITPPATAAVRPGETPAIPVPPAPANQEAPAEQPEIVHAVPGNNANTGEPRQSPGIPMPPRTLPGDVRQPPAETPEAAPADPFVDHPIFTKGEYLPIERSILQVIYPMSASNFMAVVSNGADPSTHDVQLYSIAPFERKYVPAHFASTVLTSGYALSPDGRLLVRITHFGNSAELQVWDFVRGEIVARKPLGAIGEEPRRLLGFLDDVTLLCEWRGMPKQFELIALDLGNMQYTDYAISNERHAEIVTLMPDKSIAAIGVSNFDNAVRLRFWQPRQRDDNTNQRSRVFVKPFRGPFDLSPTGIAAKPGVATPRPGKPSGNRVAITYEDNRQLQLIVCDRSETNGPILNHMIPALPLPPAAPAGRTQDNRLTWLPGGGDVVAYDRFCIDAQTGRLIGTMETGPVIDQHLVNDQTMHFVVNTPKGPQVLQATIRPGSTAPAANGN